MGNLELGDDAVRFNARFGGVPRNVYVPISAVMAIYSRENGAGTMFEPEPAYENEMPLMSVEDDETTSEPSMTVIDGNLPDVPVESDDDGDEPTPPPRGRPSLRVVK